ncbi:MAG: ammonium transporter [Pseudomonadota bacterium]
MLTATVFALALLPGAAWGDDAAFASQKSADTTWLMTAAALVFLMQAGFAFLESGLSRSKNSVNILMKNIMDCCVGSILFWMVGYGLMFGVNNTGLHGEDNFWPVQMDSWGYSFLLFQMMFAATAATIASGAMAERTRFLGYLIGAGCITAFIYPVFGSWAWGGFHGGKGWLQELGFIDFAGSTVVHSVGAWCALAGIIVVGPRLGRFPRNQPPHALPGHSLNLVALGGFLLWFGWFGFNGGSTASASLNIGLINLNTQLAAAAGALGAIVGCRLIGQPMLLTMIINGILGGLVAITAGCATTTPDWAILTGLIGGIVVVLGCRLLDAWRLDDVVGAVAVHGFCGVWGTLAAGLFFAEDPFNTNRVIVQLIGIGSCFLWTFIAALFMYGLIALFFGLRADPLHEQRGLDITEHAEIGYPEFSRQSAYDSDALDRINR